MHRNNQTPSLRTSSVTLICELLANIKKHFFIYDLQEALAREQLLENKLAVLQRLVGQTETASTDAWKSLIDEVS